jgi:hypothetical protein
MVLQSYGQLQTQRGRLRVKVRRGDYRLINMFQMGQMVFTFGPSCSTHAVEQSEQSQQGGLSVREAESREDGPEVTLNTGIIGEVTCVWDKPRARSS